MRSERTPRESGLRLAANPIVPKRVVLRRVRRGLKKTLDDLLLRRGRLRLNRRLVCCFSFGTKRLMSSPRDFLACFVGFFSVDHLPLQNFSRENIRYLIKVDSNVWGNSPQLATDYFKHGIAQDHRAKKI